MVRAAFRFLPLLLGLLLLVLGAFLLGRSAGDFTGPAEPDPAQALISPSPVPSPAADLAQARSQDERRHRLELETRRLQTLRNMLADVQAPKPETNRAALRVEEITRQISQVQTQQADRSAIQRNSQLYQAQRSLSLADQQLEIQRQIQDVDRQLLVTTDPTSRETLLAQRRLLDSQLHEIALRQQRGVAAVENQVATETWQVDLERANLQDTLRTLLGSLAYWRSQAGIGAENQELVSQRVLELQNQIYRQEAVVDGLTRTQ